jgi:hypothetical protein
VPRTSQHGLQVVDPGEFPRYAEAAPHAARLSSSRIFEFGVDLLVRGLEDLAGPEP